MMSLGAFVVIGIFATSNAFLFGDPDWNNLRVTWSLNPLDTLGFNAMPRTVDEAKAQGFVMDSDCGEIAGLQGKRFVKGRDYGLVLVYDKNGYIAGIQIGVPKNDSAGFPPVNQINHPFVLVGNTYFVTAYFTNPATICSIGRTAAQYASHGTGDSLYIQNGTDPVADSLKIPMVETDVSTTKWTKGHCFVSMGMHYWYDVKADMSCDDFFPVFLLYNHGKLNAFGWALGRAMDTTRYPYLEHPSGNVIKSFINPVPHCLVAKPALSTLHIYLTNIPLADTC
ncbi:uncharacterized protein LOC110441354 [Mizuhopecten yessoensis]|uniref:Uncharacterized protein n=1 Tax=Mizuhopecten yessoensis TaxID=6573 RepID=A0A210R159_MIZYE|nr:uncharacterized protein LOC110441354 [Mizuhopecten yessoensis]OWF54729.1 hypothetical protein KP79_PYT00308 [Mizuhopecten yessoensis]